MRVNAMPQLTRKIWMAAIASGNGHKNRDAAHPVGRALAALYADEAGSAMSSDLDALLDQIDQAEGEVRRKRN